MTIDTNNITKSWKTTAIGIASLAYGSYQIYMGPGGLSGALHDPTVIGSFLIGLMGLFTKDHDVTGGTKGQPSTTVALAAANQAPATGINSPQTPAK